jgi:electron transfer flavoprotein alpha/beta subunit
LNSGDIGAEESNLGLKGSPTQVRNIFAPGAKKDRKMLEGTTDEKVDALVRELTGVKCL